MVSSRFEFYQSKTYYPDPGSHGRGCSRLKLKTPAPPGATRSSRSASPVPSARFPGFPQAMKNRGGPQTGKHTSRALPSAYLLYSPPDSGAIYLPPGQSYI